MVRFCFIVTLVVTSLAALVPAQYGLAGRDVSATSTRTVSGTRIAHYKDGPVPIDLSHITIAALVPNGSGGYNVFPGTGTSNGTFTVPNVPGGFYLLQLDQRRYLWTKNTVVDADYNFDFRSGFIFGDQNTTLTFDLTNLHPWQSTDFFELLCPNNSAFDLFPGTVGETTFAGTFPYMDSLSDASKGDQDYIIQLITQNLGNYPFTALGKFIAPPKFTQQQGSDTRIDGRLRTIARSHHFEANISGADLATQALAANPNATLLDTSIFLDVYPGSLAKGDITSSPDLVIYNFSTGQPPITTNGDLGQVSYGNPFPTKWPFLVTYTWTAQTNYFVPGTDTNIPIPTSVTGNTPKLPTSTSPIKPLVGVLNNPSINGGIFFGNRTGVGLTPLLKWSPPRVGVATYYDVWVYQASSNAVLKARLRTQRRSLVIPPGVLSSGNSYVFLIRSVYIPGLDFAKTPFMYGPTTASADVISGLMQP
jgi:hypothetical protein